MINLIPTKEKKQIKIWFFLRLLSVAFFALSFLGVVAVLAISPSFIISQNRKVSAEKKLAEERNKEMPQIDKDAQATVKDLDNRLTSIEKSMGTKYLFSEEIIKEILSRKIPGISISRISYQSNDLSPEKSVGISFLAKDRETLLRFGHEFDNDQKFKGFSLPISIFVKGRNIGFNADLTTK